MIDLSKLSQAELDELSNHLNSEKKRKASERREAYESLRAGFMFEIRNMVLPLVSDVKAFHEFIEKNATTFRDIMREYGQLKTDAQLTYTLDDGNFRFAVKSNKVKSFDERADIAASRLIDYLKAYVQHSEKGTEDGMYQLAMTLLERNKQGDLDYQSISKLYALESKFDEEYSSIMKLFQESNVVYKTAINYYFYQKRESDGVWIKLEPSFNRL